MPARATRRRTRGRRSRCLGAPKRDASPAARTTAATRRLGAVSPDILHESCTPRALLRGILTVGGGHGPPVPTQGGGPSGQSRTPARPRSLASGASLPLSADGRHGEDVGEGDEPGGRAAEGPAVVLGF